MIKVLFVIHDLSVGGAEKVLINLVNNMDASKFDITVMALFDEGINKQFLAPHIRYISCFKKAIRGNSHFMKLLSPKQLHKWLIKERYDIEVSYLEGPSSRIVSGCSNGNTKLASWIHTAQLTKENVARAFRNYEESEQCYKRFDYTVCVSNTVRSVFNSIYNLENPTRVVYNTNESEKIIRLSKEDIPEALFKDNEIKIIGMGKIIPNKGFDRLARIHKKLIDDGLPVHTYVLGVGNQEEEIRNYLNENRISETFSFLGYQTNPYKFLSKSDLFVCTSHYEGFSTAATEALIVGIPVCTVEVSGMKEMLGENNEYGMITDNNDEALYEGIKELIVNTDKRLYYKRQSVNRGRMFNTKNTVQAVEKLLEEMWGKDSSE